MTSEIVEIENRTLDGMRSFMNSVRKDGGDPGYTEAEIEKCKLIIDSYIQNVSNCSPGDEQSVMSAIQKVVLDLNALNSASGECLIETDQREDLAELIIKVAHQAGVGDGQEDLTEEWREW